MDKHNLWSLRLGFSLAQAGSINMVGLEEFLKLSMDTPASTELPAFMQGLPSSIDDVIAYRSRFRRLSEAERKEALRANNTDVQQLRLWWLNRMRTESLPLREKMCVFWHNHFVATSQKVRVLRWVYQHNAICRRHAFGNFRELTREIIRSNAIITYLDNNENRKNKLNENLSRELLELFTLGIGNYSESDIREGAKALAGLTAGDNGGVYRARWTYDGYVEYLGGRGKYKIDDLIDRIFEHPESPYLVTHKIIRWFLYDEPEEEMVRYYGNYFREQDFEVAPLLTKLFLEEEQLGTSARKIKDPLVFILQLLHELQFDPGDNQFVLRFLRQQGMELFNQPNVKGWPGGRNWLTTQIYEQREKTANLLCAGLSRDPDKVRMGQRNFNTYNPQLEWDDNSQAQAIKTSLVSRTLMETPDDLDQALEELMPYDFDPKTRNAQRTVGRVFNYLVTTPEFQLI